MSQFNSLHTKKSQFIQVRLLDSKTTFIVSQPDVIPRVEVKVDGPQKMKLDGPLKCLSARKGIKLDGPQQ